MEEEYITLQKSRAITAARAIKHLKIMHEGMMRGKKPNTKVLEKHIRKGEGVAAIIEYRIGKV